MTIKANVDAGRVTLTASADNTAVSITSLAVDRYSVTTMSAHNTGAGSATIDIYISPDATSASGVKVGTYIVPNTAGSNQADMSVVIGQGYTENIIVRPSIAGVTIDSSVTTFTGDD